MDHPTNQPPIAPLKPQNISSEIKDSKNRDQIFLIGTIIILILIIFGLLAYIVINNNANIAKNVNSFEECVAAGNPVMESYPRQCRSKDGRLFVEEVDGVGTVTPPPSNNNEEETPITMNTVYLYFPKDPESYDDPTLTFVTTRDTEREDVVAFAIEELIKGPTSDEVEEENLFSEIKLTGSSNCDGSNFTFEIVSGTITVQFCRALESPGVLADARIKEMITKTLQQFTYIEKVILLDRDGNELFDQSGM